MSQRSMQRRAAIAQAANGPVAVEVRPAGWGARLLHSVLRRFGGRRPGTAEDQERLRARLEHEG